MLDAEHPVRKPWHPVPEGLALGSRVKAVSPRRADPVDRLPDERDSEIDAPSHLRGEFLESFGPKRAGSPLLRAAGISGVTARWKRA